MRLIAPLVADGPTQMAVDEALLENATEPTLRVYAWNPATISLGYFQDHDAVAARCPAGMPIVRRITGGGAIWHDHEVTYCLIGDLGSRGLPERTRDCYGLVHDAIRRSLAKRGVALASQSQSAGDRRYQEEPRCFASPAAGDLIAGGGGKVLGSAARTRGNRLLMHGSLKLASNPWDGEATAPCGLDWESAAEVVREAVARACGETLEPGPLAVVESAARDRILAERYGSPDWVRLRKGPRP